MGLNPVGATQPQPKSKLEKTAIAAGIGGGVGTLLGAGGEYLIQKIILKDPVTFAEGVKASHGVVEGSATADPKAAKNIQKILDKVEALVEKGKCDFKLIGKSALIGAAKVAATFGLIYFIGKSIIDWFKDDKQPEAPKQTKETQKAEQK